MYKAAKIDALRAEWYLLKGYLVVNLQSAMEYRGSFISQVVFMFLNDVLLLFFWWVLFSQLPSLSNWQLRDVVLLYSISASAYAVHAVVFGSCMSLAHTIAEGGLDFYLTLPRNPLWHLLISRSTASAWGDLVFGVIAFAWATGGDLKRLLMYPLFLATGGIIFTAFGVIAGSLAFYWGNSESFAGQLYEALISFTLYPDGIFSPGVRMLLYTIIPAGFVAYLPVSLVHNFRWELALVLLGASLCGVLLAGLVFGRGLRRYESGNLVAPRM